MNSPVAIKKKQGGVLLALFGIVILCATHTIASDIQNEKSSLLNSYFGDFRKAKIQKTSGTKNIEVWKPWAQHVQKSFPAHFQSALLSGPQKLAVEYDEIWVSENDEHLTKAEKRKYQGQLDILKLYWKNGKVQAGTVEKFYQGNPLTGDILPSPAHKITDINTRSHILQRLREN